MIYLSVVHPTGIVRPPVQYPFLPLLPVIYCLGISLFLPGNLYKSVGSATEEALGIGRVWVHESFRHSVHDPAEGMLAGWVLEVATPKLALRLISAITGIKCISQLALKPYRC